MKIISQRKKRAHGFLLSGLILTVLNATNISAAQYKHVAVPPQQMNQQKLPEAKSKGVFSHSTMLPIYARASTEQSVNKINSKFEIEQPIFFDGKDDSPIIFIGPEAANWQLTLTDPNGLQVYSEVDSPSQRLPVENIAVGSETFKGKQLMMNTPSVGTWRVKLTRQQSDNNSLNMAKPSADSTQSIAKPSGSQKPEGYLMFKGDADFQVYSYLDNNFTVQNAEINLVAYSIDAKDLPNKRKLMQKRKALQGTITEAVAYITSPSNRQSKIPLRDDGLNGDAIAGDGRYSGAIPTDEVGVYTSQIQIVGIRPDGVRYSRTTTDLYPIAKPVFKFVPTSASITQSAQGAGIVSVPVEQINPAQRVFLSAEVWGKNTKGQEQSASWIGGIVTPIHSVNGTRLELAMDLRWLKRNQLRAPYSLKNLRLQTVEDNVPLTQLAQLPIKTDRSLAKNSSLDANAFISQSITPDMLSLVSPGEPLKSANFAQEIQQSVGVGNKLMLVHGYCSGDVWNTAQFSNSVKFADFNQNRSHDAFALKIYNFGTAFASYGIVAHSQGGAAALHLYAKYYSGLDSASGGRLIQSVGTPYQGTALAGNAAVLGQIFGVGCGKNTDLTYSGSANWLSTIPSWARAEVDYYTTSFKDRWWAYDYCHLVTDLLLNDPEDGTTEKWSGQLSGAVNKGHKTGWCHTTGMRDPAQYTDASRNSSMSSRAAR